MRTKALALLLALALGACASSSGPPSSGSRGGEIAVSVVGTPVLWVFKAAVCAGSLVVAAPTAAILALGADPYNQGFEYLGSGLAQNCGPPYVLTPSTPL